jgi:putative protein kinase ArgK-like GTPase of G3E family
LKTIATTGEGVPALWSAIGQFRAHSETVGSRRRERYEHRLRERLGRQFFDHLEKVLPPGELDRTVGRIAAGEIDLYSAAAELMSRALPNATPHPR